MPNIIKAECERNWQQQNNKKGTTELSCLKLFVKPCITYKVRIAVYSLLWSF